MEMQQIRYFLSLAGTLNFTRAAEECNVSQPALTRAIQALEAELGGDLIRREGRLSHLTDLGKRMLPLLQRCYDSAQTARSLARAVSRSEIAPLSLAVSNGVNLETIMEPVSELFSALPGIQLKILHGTGAESIARLKEGGVDLALCPKFDADWERLESWDLYSEGIEVAVANGGELAEENPVDPARLKDFTILTLAGGDCRAMVAQWFDALGIPLTFAHEVDSLHDLAALVAASGGVAFVPESAPSQQGVCRAKVKDMRITRTVAVFSASGRARSVSTSTLLNLLRSAPFKSAV
jgi:DNA-binding transcriptional LysR family regulator